MVDVVIHDPDGPAVKVENGRLKVKSISQTALEDVSAEKGQAFSWTSTFDTGTTDLEVFTIKNDAIGKHLHIDQLWLSSLLTAVFSWGKVTSGTPAGTPVIGQPLNLDLGQTAEATAFGNASVTGTVVVADNAWFMTPATDSTRIDLEGAWVLGKDDTFGLRCATDTTVYVTVIGHYDAINP